MKYIHFFKRENSIQAGELKSKEDIRYHCKTTRTKEYVYTIVFTDASATIVLPDDGDHAVYLCKQWDIWRDSASALRYLRRYKKSIFGAGY